VGDVTDILLVGHDSHDCDELLLALDIHGLAQRTVVVHDVQQALDHLQRAPIGLVLIGIKDRESPGFNVLRQAKANPALRVIPVVALNHSTDSAMEAELVRAGANSVVVPPRAPAKLREVMGHVGLYWALINRPMSVSPVGGPRHPPESSPERDHESLRVLVVDSSLVDAEGVIARLEDEGYLLSLELATQLDELVQCITQLEYDLIIVEAALPTFPLAEVAAALDEHDAAVPFLVVTGAPSREGMRTALALGAEDYLDKNRLEHLPTAVQRILHKRSALAAAHEQEQRDAARAARQQLMLDVLEMALDSPESAATIECAIRGLAGALSADACAFFELQPNEDRMMVQSGLGWQNGVVGQHTLDAYAGTILGFALGQQASVLVTDFRTDRRFTAPSLLDDHQIRSGVCVTIDGDAQRDVGVLGVFSTTPEHFSSEHVELVEAVSRLLSKVLRRGRSAEAPQSVAETRIPGARSDGRTGDSETILLVEQEDTVRHQVSHTLTDCGYTVLAAATAEEAVTRATAWQGRVDLVLTELTEPGISGPKLIELVRAKQPNINVLFISKYRDLILALPDMPEERVGWLHKPFPDEELLSSVRRLLAIGHETGNHGP